MIVNIMVFGLWRYLAGRVFLSNGKIWPSLEETINDVYLLILATPKSAHLHPSSVYGTPGITDLAWSTYLASIVSSL